MLMKNIKPLTEPSWVSFYSVIENLDVCFSFPLIVYTEVFRSRTATVFLTACTVPPLSTSLSSELSLYIFTVAWHRLFQNGKSCSFINISVFSVLQMFFSMLTQRLVFTFPLGGKFERGMPNMSLIAENNKDRVLAFMKCHLNIQKESTGELCTIRPTKPFY